MGLRRRLGPALLVLAAAGGVAGIYLMPTPPTEKEVVETPPVNVVVEVVERQPRVEETFDLPGTIEPNRVVKVAAEVAGRIEFYGRRAETITWQGRSLPEGQTIDEGQPVRQGDTLLQLNRDILAAERDRAEAQRAWDQSEYQRLLGLQTRGATTAREVTEATSKAAISQAALRVAEQQLERTAIRSPIGGVINRMMREVGEYVMPGMEIAEIVEIDPVKVVVDVPERDVPYLAVGQEEQILPDRDAAPLATGRITYISELANPLTRASRVEITIANPDHRLRSGQIVRVRLTRDVRQNVVMIPLKAVIPLEEGYEVYVVQGNKARRRTVNLGFLRQDRVLAEGLETGDRLIVQGHRLVSSGQRVNVIESTKDASPALAGQGPAAASRPAAAQADPPLSTATQ